MQNKNSGGSKGILEGLNINSKLKNKENVQNDNHDDNTSYVKRSYTLKSSTIKKLQELKVFVYSDPSIKYNEIVDEAINYLYDLKKEKQ